MDENEIRKMWMERMAQEKKNKRVRYSKMNKDVIKGQILFAGSSLMENFTIDELQHNYKINKIIYNRGIGGFIMKEFEDALEECVFALEPSRMFLNIGTNDMNGPEFDIHEFISNYERILDKIKERLPDLEVYLMAYYPVNPDVAEGYIRFALQNRTNERINNANNAVKEMALKRGIKFINVNAPITDEKGRLKAEYAIEGMHFYPDGYAAIMPLLVPYLNEKY